MPSSNRMAVTHRRAAVASRTKNRDERETRTPARKRHDRCTGRSDPAYEPRFLTHFFDGMCNVWWAWTRVPTAESLPRRARRKRPLRTRTVATGNPF